MKCIDNITKIGKIKLRRNGYFAHDSTSETYLMSDGTYECVVYAENKYYLDENEVLPPVCIPVKQARH